MLIRSLHSNMEGNRFTFSCDKIQDITSFEQLALYATFIMNGEVTEHFIGLIPISKVAATHMSTVNNMSALEKFFKDLDITPLRNARLTCMNSINVNSGVENGLKCHLKHSIPMLWCIGCNNHKLALHFKHVIAQFPTIFKTFLLSL